MLNLRAGSMSVITRSGLRERYVTRLHGTLNLHRVTPSKLVDTKIDFYQGFLIDRISVDIIYATFLPTFPTPLPTMLTTMPPGSSASSLMPHPLRPNALKSLAS